MYNNMKHLWFCRLLIYNIYYNLVDIQANAVCEHKWNHTMYFLSSAFFYLIYIGALSKLVYTDLIFFMATWYSIEYIFHNLTDSLLRDI